MSKGKIALIVLALAAVALSLLNASWIAPTPRGRLILVAKSGVAQQPADPAAIGDCMAASIRPPEHEYIDNSVHSIRRAYRIGADAVEIQVQPTADGAMVAFEDARLECRTNGTGAVRERPLDYLKSLDIGHGYTADGGATFPLRGRGIGAMPTIEEVLREVPRNRLVFNFSGRAEDADLLAAAFARAGQEVDPAIHSFSGSEEAVRRIRELVPGVWAWSIAEGEQCRAEYVRWGWIGHVPDACRDGTVLVPLNARWTVWGWPNRFQARMASAGARPVMMGDMADGEEAIGIRRADQLPRVPRDFRGHLWVEDINTIGPAIR